MLGYRRLAAVGAVATLAFGLSGSAFAATPQKIYADLVDNGRLDGKYTRAEIERAFKLPPVVRTDRTSAPRARKPLEVTAENESTQPTPVTTKSERRVPFSALDAALLFAGGGPLLLIGAGLRRRMSGPATGAPVVGG